MTLTCPHCKEEIVLDYDSVGLGQTMTVVHGSCEPFEHKIQPVILKDRYEVSGGEEARICDWCRLQLKRRDWDAKTCPNLECPSHTKDYDLAHKAPNLRYRFAPDSGYTDADYTKTETTWH